MMKTGQDSRSTHRELPAGEMKNEEKVAINGFAQVLEMLRIADPAFRESLLKRLASKDPELARTLRNDLHL